MIPDTTLVTCFFDMSKYNPKTRNINDDLGKIKTLLETPCYLVIYTDEIFYEHVKKIRDNCGYEKLTNYQLMNVEDLDTFKYLDIVKSNRQKYHPTKDERTCAESHLVCCSKFELVLKTIENNPFNTSKFAWIDGFVGENFSRICINYKNNTLLNILDKCYNDKFHIKILNVCDKKYIKEENLHEYYSQYRWIVCGGLFVTGKEIGKKILRELNNVFIKHTMLGYGHGEEMFYLEVLEKHYDDFCRSYGDYGYILNNFLNVTVGLDYVHSIAQKYMQIGYHRECIECCNKVIKQFENFNIEMNYGIYFNLLFYKYVSLYYYDINNCKEFLKYFLQLIEMHPNIQREYQRQKGFYDDQFKYGLQLMIN